MLLGEKVRSSLLVWLISLVSTATACANGSEVTGSDAGTIVPIESTDIRLLSEDLDIDLKLTDGSDGGRVKCHYILHNLSEKHRNISMAFITTSSHEIAWNDFIVTQDGDPVAVHLALADKEKWSSVAGSLPDSLPVWNLHFKPGSAINLLISYPVRWSSFGDPRRLQFTYNARPAALWAGTVLTATISFELSPILATLLQCHRPDDCLRVSVEPNDYDIDDKGLVWRYSDWEPAEDIKVSLEWPQGD